MGLYDTNSVSERIRLWQEQGAAVTTSFSTASDISNSAVEDDALEEKVRTPAPAFKNKENAKDEETTPRRHRSRWVDVKSREYVREAQSTGTPKRRVISDDHWKKPRSPKETRSGQSAPRKSLREDENSCDSPRDQSSIRRRKGDLVTKRSEPRTNTSDLREKEQEENGRPRVTPSSSRKQSCKGPPIVEVVVDTQSNVDYELAGRLSSSPPLPSSSRQLHAETLIAEKEHGPHRRGSQYADALGRSPGSLQGSSGKAPSSVRSNKGSIFNQAKEMFTRSEHVSVPSPRVPSIEAWLNEQPDPFVDDGGGLVDVPAPLRMQSRRQGAVAEEMNGEDPNQIWSFVTRDDPRDLRPSSGGRRKKRRSTAFADSEQNGSLDSNPDTSKARQECSESQKIDQDLSSGGLKRRGAKSSRARRDSSPLKEINSSKELPILTTQNGSPSESVEDDSRPQNLRSRPLRHCPPTGPNRLSTIASVETFQYQPGVVEDHAVSADTGRGLERRLTTHEDLMSVLSLPRAGKSIRSARSVRATRSRMAEASLAEVVEQLAEDEGRYVRELRTLVDGVIPVLLQSVLSKSDSSAALGLFASSSTSRDDLSFTKPIVDMGIALERLKTTHGRLPTKDFEALLSWGQSAHRVYSEYLKAWRLGFQDVVVNLAPAENPLDGQATDGIVRDDDGDVLNAEGRKADVAYLLKRPMVRIKSLSKVFDRIKILKPSSRASRVAADYADLVIAARRRLEEEQGRLEDEAAANIDSTKARDLRTLAVLAGVKINKSRKVKARDCFNLTLHHSTGQRVDCRVEVVLRDNQVGSGHGGDLLFCEVDETGKWLLLPPIETKMASAHTGDTNNDLVVVIRGSAGHGLEWHELLSLKADSSDAAIEWVQMLGSRPLPSNLDQSPSFMNSQQESLSGFSINHRISIASEPVVPKIPGPRDIEVPIGEPSITGCKDLGQLRRVVQSVSPKPESPHQSSDDVLHTPQRGSGLGLRRTRAGRRNARSDDGSPNSALSAESPRNEANADPARGPRRLSRTDDASREWMGTPENERSVAQQAVQDDSPATHQDGGGRRPERLGYHRTLSSTPSKELPTISRLRPVSQERMPASTPLNESIREQWANLSGTSEKDDLPQETSFETRRPSRPSERDMPFTEDVPAPPPHSGRSQKPSNSPVAIREPGNLPALPQLASNSPQTRSPKALPLSHRVNLPVKNTKLRDRRSSSPLKHEYAPSTGSESSNSDSDDATSSSSETSTDAMSEHGDAPTPLLAITAATLRRSSQLPPPASLPSLPPATLAPSNSASQAPYRTVPSASALPNARSSKTIAMVCSWSDKGLWESLHPDECSIIISPGLIEAYEMSAAHSGSKPKSSEDQNLNSESISGISSYLHGDGSDVRPLVAFELTPLVPLRRGTALDISIRSPPTEKSKIRTSNNVMFRSRNAEECEALYAMINYARINNPTYIALQNARPSYQPPVTFNTGSARHSSNGSRSRSGSWFGLGSHGKRSSYRASSAPGPSSPSVGGMSETSVGSISGAFSALRHFSGSTGAGKGVFNLSRSSVSKKSGSMYSSNSGTTSTGGSGSGTTSPAPSQLGHSARTDGTGSAAAGSVGVINNLKIRLYVRESVSRWRDLGSARLTVLPVSGGLGYETDGKGTLTNAVAPEPSPPSVATNQAHPLSAMVIGEPNASRGPRLPSSNTTPHRVHGNGQEKRVVITSKSNDSKLLLDAILGESCFERIARTGIAVNVWSEDRNIAKVGGVAGGRGTTYMIQMKGEAETSWVFGLVGRLRY